MKRHGASTGQAGLLVAAGHHQSGAAGAELPQPLTVLALNAQGDPVAGQTVTFEVLRGTGALSPTQGQTAGNNANYTSRAVMAVTDAEGKARAWYTVGRLSGPGANAVQARAPGLGGEDVQFTATTQKGAPARITADFGQNQISETGAQAMELLSAVVRDAHNNYVSGVKVRFKVEEGDASFEQGAATAIVTTDKNGIAAARPASRLSRSLLMAALALLVCAEAAACRCVERRPELHYERASRVVIGTVTAVNEAAAAQPGSQHVREVVVRVDEVLKGDGGKTLRLTDDLSHCSLFLQAGDRVILFLRLRSLDTDRCSGSAALHSDKVLRSRFGMDEAQVQAYQAAVLARVEAARRLSPRRWWQVWR